MLRWLVILLTVLGIFFAFLAGYFWFEARGWINRARKEKAKNVRQDISDNFERIKADLKAEGDEDKWKELDDRLGKSRRR